MATQDELIQSIINSLKRIPPLNIMQNDVNILKEKSVLMSGATPNTNGKSGFVPAPTSSEYNKFLRGDGTWQTVITEGIGDIAISDIGTSNPITSGSVLFTISNNSSIIRELNKTDLVRFTGDSSDSRMMYLSLGKTGSGGNVNSGLELCKGLYKFKLKPPVNVSASMSVSLPPYTGVSDIELASTDWTIKNYYNRTETDSKYLNKTIRDTAAEISVYGAGLSYGGFRILQPWGSEGKSIMMRNDGSRFWILTSPTKDGAWDNPSIGQPFAIDLSSSRCDINGYANYANYDRWGRLIDGTYAVTNSDASFASVSIRNANTGAVSTLSNDAYSNITLTSAMRSTANITDNTGYWYRNMSAGTGTTPGTTGVPWGSVYLQYS